MAPGQGRRGDHRGSGDQHSASAQPTSVLPGGGIGGIGGRAGSLDAGETSVSSAGGSGVARHQPVQFHREWSAGWSVPSAGVWFRGSRDHTGEPGGESVVSVGGGRPIAWGRSLGGRERAGLGASRRGNPPGRQRRLGNAARFDPGHAREPRTVATSRQWRRDPGRTVSPVYGTDRR